MECQPKLNEKYPFCNVFQKHWKYPIYFFYKKCVRFSHCFVIFLVHCFTLAFIHQHISFFAHTIFKSFIQHYLKKRFSSQIFFNGFTQTPQKPEFSSIRKALATVIQKSKGFGFAMMPNDNKYRMVMQYEHTENHWLLRKRPNHIYFLVNLISIYFSVYPILYLYILYYFIYIAISTKFVPLKMKMSKYFFSNISFLKLISGIYVIQSFRVRLRGKLVFQWQ